MVDSVVTQILVDHIADSSDSEPGSTMQSTEDDIVHTNWTDTSSGRLNWFDDLWYRSIVEDWYGDIDQVVENVEAAYPDVSWYEAPEEAVVSVTPVIFGFNFGF